VSEPADNVGTPPDAAPQRSLHAFVPHPVSHLHRRTSILRSLGKTLKRMPRQNPSRRWPIAAYRSGQPMRRPFLKTFTA